MAMHRWRPGTACVGLGLILLLTAAFAACTSTAPAAPAAPTAIPSSTQVRLVWTAPTSGGSPITGYVVTPFKAGVAQPATTFASTATTQDVTGLASGTAYTFEVAAVNAVGTGPNSPASATVTTLTSWLVPVAGQVAQIVVDSTGKYAYATNKALNEVEVLDIATRTLLTPIPVGSQPYGIDFSPDGKTLYVANSGGSSLSVVNVATRTVTKLITIPPAPTLADRPLTIAIASNNIALVGTTFNGSGYGGRLMSVNIATGAVNQSNCCLNHLTTEITPMRASGDRSKIFFTLGDDSGGRVYSYTAATDTISPSTSLNASVRNVSVDGTGQVVAWDNYQGTQFTDGSLLLQGTVSGGGQTAAAVSPAGDTAYRVENDPTNYSANAVLRFISITRFLGGSSEILADSVPVYSSSSVALVPGGSLAVIESTHGMVVAQLPTF